MRKIIFLIHMSLDGYVAGPNGEMDWIVYGEDIANNAYSLHDKTDTAIYGRVTYEMMAGYWPHVLDNPDSDAGDRRHAVWVNDATKIVVSTTLETTNWQNAEIVRSDLESTFNRMKQEPGKDMWLLGSPTLAQNMMRLNLIDEYWMNISPVVLGRGKPMFAENDKLTKLNLIETKLFEGGVVGLRYMPTGN